MYKFIDFAYFWVSVRFWIIDCFERARNIGGAAYMRPGRLTALCTARRSAKPLYYHVIFLRARSHDMYLCVEKLWSTQQSTLNHFPLVSDDWHFLRATKTWQKTTTSGFIRRCSTVPPRALGLVLKSLNTYFWQVVLVVGKCVLSADMFNNVAKWFESISGKKLAGPKELA